MPKPKQRGNKQGSIYPDQRHKSNGLWRWSMTIGYTKEGKRLQRGGSAPSRTEAALALAQAQTDHARGQLSATHKITLQQHAEDWLQRQTDIKPQTLERYHRELSFALDRIGNLRLTDIRPSHLQTLMSQLKKVEMKAGRGHKKPMSIRTQKKIIIHLKAIFRDAVMNQLIHVDPMISYKAPRAGRRESVATVLEVDQARYLGELGAVLYDENLCRLWPAIYLGLHVGLRRGEIMGLSWASIDFGARIIRVEQQLIQQGGKALLQQDLKTESSRREVPMTDALHALLLRHRQRQMVERRAAGKMWEDNDAVFSTENGRWVVPDNLNRALKNLIGWTSPDKGQASKGGMGTERLARIRAVTKDRKPLPHLTPHDLRHIHTTLALSKGAPLATVSHRLGHSKVSITLDVYRHILTSEEQHPAIDILES
ncbi:MULTISPECIES: tyrosine-type recombinase/integrase [unclassified Deinococcus]|uniref:tyrosine-type recombinase/integrase n=1 Tax=unclassified Deinococcus TaxID=2623546 RepID=UPI001C2FCD5C|nr:MULTISPECIES: site-specific integrase [unclassified Deinococcus]MDK2011000.1 tyrosine-type recombinase/integrase [Deinococcus sp. 43]